MEKYLQSADYGCYDLPNGPQEPSIRAVIKAVQRVSLAATLLGSLNERPIKAE